jgi:hypothetical protein
VTRPPNFYAARGYVDEAMSAMNRASAQLRVQGAERQHPFYYRANQFWRQLEEFRADLARAATDAIPQRREG